MKILPEFTVGGLEDRLLYRFSKFHSGKLALANESLQMQAIMPFMVGSADGKLVYMKNAKCACTSICHSIYTYDTGESFTGNIHKRGKHLQQGYSHWKKNWIRAQGSDRFLFSFVRHPVKRFVSAFTNFIVDASNTERQHHLQDFERYGITGASDMSSSFDRFISMAEDEITDSPLKTDQHWRPQVFNLGMTTMSYDFIGKVENISSDFQIVREAIGANARTMPLKRNNRTNSLDRYSPTPEQQKRLIKLYEMDFEAFSYSDEIS